MLRAPVAPRARRAGRFSGFNALRFALASETLALQAVDFSISGALILLSFINSYYIAPRLQANACSPENPSACENASKVSRVLLWLSASIYAFGFFVANVFGPLLTRIDNG